MLTLQYIRWFGLRSSSIDVKHDPHDTLRCFAAVRFGGISNVKISRTRGSKGGEPGRMEIDLRFCANPVIDEIWWDACVRGKWLTGELANFTEHSYSNACSNVLDRSFPPCQLKVIVLTVKLDFRATCFESASRSYGLIAGFTMMCTDVSTGHPAPILAYVTSHGAHTHLNRMRSQNSFSHQYWSTPQRTFYTL